MNVAIDGPAGAGKSTVAKGVSKAMNYIYVDTGAMYRAIGVFFLINAVDIHNEEACKAVLDRISVTIAYENGVQQVLLNGVNVSPIIRTEAVSQAASLTSTYASVREKLLSLQRKLAAENDVVMDGRDIGTVILPQAEVKVYLTASTRVRALRRLKEYEEKGILTTLEELEKEIDERDQRDMNREIAPLRQAEDAIYLDSSYMTADEVIGAVVQLIRERL
ncbi:MAG: (d)CMP kinase [Lachnospiraceae bacterium]|nr:(d)CMP kinase [Lachnospiraceae bacterium]